MLVSINQVKENQKLMRNGSLILGLHVIIHLMKTAFVMQCIQRSVGRSLVIDFMDYGVIQYDVKIQCFCQVTKSALPNC
jgi:hypothetical protein